MATVMQAPEAAVPAGAAAAAAMRGHAPTFSVVVTCYNYGDYVVDAVESALRQVPAAAEIVVVDDGSTDDSRDRLTARYGTDPRLRLLFKENGGQLSAFAHGVAAVTGDVVCFLDADDLWEAGYLARLADLYRARPDVNFVYTNLVTFGADERLWHHATRDYDHGITILDTYLGQCWHGSPTSALSMRRPVAAAVLSLPASFHMDWRTRADDCLVYGAGILGARKYYCADARVRYRIHASNNWFGSAAQHAGTYLHDWRRRRLFAYFAAQMSLDLRDAALAKSEFRTKPAPTEEECRRYQSYLKRSPLGPLKRLEHAWAIRRHQRDPDQHAARFRDRREGPANGLGPLANGRS